MPVDSRGRLEAEPFSYVLTKDGGVRIAYHGKVVFVLKGKPAARLAAILAAADPDGVQLALAKATGNFKRGNERTAQNHARHGGDNP